MLALQTEEAATPAAPLGPGPLQLLVLQGTPFCNINCSYCYLPDRQSTRRMSEETLDRVFHWVFDSGLAREPFTVLWHAGEPLVLPVSFYETAASLLERHNVANLPVLHSFQTNATLIDAGWCEFFRRPDIHLGVSVDGPDFLHDRHRRTRQGHGTLDRVLRGIQLLNEHGIRFQVITVLTVDALDYPDELFDFYQANGIGWVGFNVEEIEGPHTASSLGQAGTPERFRRFLSRFLKLAYSADPPLVVREFETSASAIMGHQRCGPGTRTQENQPWAIVNVDWAGNFSTFSPELLGMPSPAHGGFTLGNVATDSLEAVLASPRFRRLDEEIGRGVDLCRERCTYFPFCGGGAPANKFFENQTFVSTETLFCRLHKQVCVDVTLACLEQQATSAGVALPAGSSSQAERAPA
jgi:uncharacterized protein